MPKFKQGDFVRRLSFGGVVGGLLMVDGYMKQGDERVAVHHVPEMGIGSFLMLPSKLSQMKHIYLYASEEEIKNLIEDSKSFSFTKTSATVLWEKALKNNDYKVAVIANKITGTKVVLENPEFYDPYAHVYFCKPREKNVKVTFSRLIKL